MEKLLSPLNGYKAALIALISFLIGLFGIISTAQNANPSGGVILFSVLFVVLAVFLMKGLMVVEPNYSIVLTFFGKYIGTVRENGLQFVNPFYSKLKVSLRSQSVESTKLKVNDKLGNPIEIAAVILYEVSDTYKAVFDVTNFNEYMKNQSEAAVRHLATSYPYDNIEDLQHEIITFLLSKIHLYNHCKNIQDRFKKMMEAQAKMRANVFGRGRKPTQATQTPKVATPRKRPTGTPRGPQVTPRKRNFRFRGRRT